VVRLIYPALCGIDPELLEAAALDSASSGDTWWLIELPAIRNVLLIAMGYAAIISIGDFGAANFLAYGQQGTITTVLYQLISKPGAVNYGMAMAASSILIFITFVLVGAMSY
jgi:thiamine transport system permease protein